MGSGENNVSFGRSLEYRVKRNYRAVFRRKSAYRRAVEVYDFAVRFGRPALEVEIRLGKRVRRKRFFVVNFELLIVHRARHAFAAEETHRVVVAFPNRVKVDFRARFGRKPAYRRAVRVFYFAVRRGRPAEEMIPLPHERVSRKRGFAAHINVRVAHAPETAVAVELNRVELSCPHCVKRYRRFVLRRKLAYGRAVRIFGFAARRQRPAREKFVRVCKRTFGKHAFLRVSEFERIHFAFAAARRKLYLVFVLVELRVKNEIALDCRIGRELLFRALRVPAVKPEARFRRISRKFDRAPRLDRSDRFVLRSVHYERHGVGFRSARDHRQSQ